METRKLQKVGGSTYAVSLPKEWATEHRLEAGMPIHLYPHTDGSLVVRSAAQDGAPLSRGEVRLPESGETAVERGLRAGYAVGFDAVALRPPEGASFDAAARRAGRRLAGTLVGLSVTEEAANRITVESVLDASAVSIRQSLIQLQFTALSMHRTAVEALSSATEPADRLARRDDEADRLFDMMTRHFNRSLTDLSEIDHLDVGRPELFDHYLAARQLERVADHAVDVGRIADRTDAGLPAAVVEDVTSLAADAREVVETATTAVVEGSTDTAHAALDRREAVVDDVLALDRALYERSPPGAYACSRVLAGVDRTADCGGNVATIALRAGVRSSG
jgi:phosphate uptake regulator